MIINHQVHPIKRYSIFEWIWMQKKKVIVYIRGKYVPSNSFRSGSREISWAIFIATFLTSSTLKRGE